MLRRLLAPSSPSSPFASASLFAFASIAALGSVGCRENQDPDGAKTLLARVEQGEGFRAWARAPGYPTRQPSFTAHANEVEIFISPEVSTALASPAQLVEFPVGSTIVKEGFNSGRRAIVAVMEKRADGWFWAEYDDSGAPLFSGQPKVCINCHNNRATYSDWVYSFEFSR